MCLGCLAPQGRAVADVAPEDVHDGGADEAVLDETGVHEGLHAVHVAEDRVVPAMPTFLDH